MKKLGIIYILLIVFYLPCVGQDYFSIFGIDTTQWNYFTDYGGADFYATAIYKAYNDTNINGNQYKILFENYLWNNSLFGFLKEDTINGKVWLRRKNDTIDFLLMDLSLGINDTFLLENTQWEGWDEKYLVKNKINESNGIILQLAGIKGYTEIEFIEGIGVSYIFHFIEEPWVFSELLCAYKDNILKYDSPEIAECYIPFQVEIKKFETDHFKIFPIPAKDILNISFSNNNIINNSIKLLDITGKTILEQNKLTNMKKLDISEFENGLYFIIINNQIVKKIIINGR